MISMEKIFTRIISGGQTGVDRAALDIARELSLPSGGWCPKGRRAEDGPIDPSYPLKETESSSYPVRTDKNVLDSDGTLILTRGNLKGGTALTRKLARAAYKPYLIVNLFDEEKPQIVLEWARRYKISLLNVAGPRESEAPGIYGQAARFLKKVLLTY
jgi:hypothetical protein